MNNLSKISSGAGKILFLTILIVSGFFLLPKDAGAAIAAFGHCAGSG